MNIEEKLTDALAGIAGYGDIRFDHNQTFTIALRNGKSEIVNPVELVGGGVRVLLPGHGWGFAVFNSLDDLESAVSDAVDSSRAVIPDDPIKLVPVEPIVAEVSPDILDDFRNHTNKEKYELLLEYDELAATVDDRIIERMLRYNETFATGYLITTDGTRITRKRSDCVLRCSFRAKAGDVVQSAHKSYADRHSFKELTNRHEVIKHIAKIAAQMLDAKPVKGGVYPVVLDPALAGVFIHEAFGHLSEADFIDENPQAQKMMRLGRKFGPEFLNVIDDGAVMPQIRGTINYDDEGVPSQKTYLVREGVLVGRLHSRQTAGKLSEKPTGNARAQDFRYYPIVRMTNTAIEVGPHPADKIFDGIKEGVYAVDAYGGETELESFSFSAGYAYMIRNGEVAELVRNVVLQGNLFQTLANIEQVADDFVWDSSGGYCGKDGQHALTQEGSPHIRIKDVVIAGE